MYERKNGPRTTRDNRLQAGKKRTFSYKSPYGRISHRISRLNISIYDYQGAMNVAQSSRRIPAFNVSLISKLITLGTDGQEQHGRHGKYHFNDDRALSSLSRRPSPAIIYHLPN